MEWNKYPDKLPDEPGVYLITWGLGVKIARWATAALDGYFWRALDDDMRLGGVEWFSPIVLPDGTRNNTVYQ